MNRTPIPKRAFFCIVLVMGFILIVRGQATSDLVTLPMDKLDAFRDPGSNWVIASDAVADLNKDGYMKAIAGTSAIVNIMNPKNNTHLVTKKEFGDLQLELDFMMAKHSNSGVFLQGRYEIQLFDSWTKPDPAFSDCGGIYQRWDDARGSNREGYEGIPPMMNVSRAPGLWQHLKITFQAPRFNEKGEKVANARFNKVYLNGVLVQLESDVTGPTRSSYFDDEKPQGPLVLQGDHGNVAFRNIRYGAPDTVSGKVSTDDPILINPTGKPYLLRSFLNYGDKKLTHVISAGYPNQLNYSYDLKQGALIQVWRGKFMDVTDMWHDRGEPQLAKPLGSVIILSDAPALALLPDANAPWPDSVAFDDFQNKGYTLDESRFPSFEYVYNGINVKDKIAAGQPGSLTREISVTAPPAGLYCRVAAADRIELLGNGLYAVQDKSYLIKIDDRYKATIRKTPNGQELLVSMGMAGTTLTYSIIW